MKLETKESATEKIKELRAHVAKDKASKVQDGQDRRRAGHEKGEAILGQDKKQEGDSGRAGGVTWKAPVEMEKIDFTPQESEFAQSVGGGA